MTQEEYHVRRRRIEAERQRAIELIEAAHRAQLRALDLVWLGGGAGQAQAPGAPPAAADPAPPTWPAAPLPRTTQEVASDIEAALARLPEVFTTSDLLGVLGYVPHRGTLHRLLKELESEGTLRVEWRGEGRKATGYRQISPARAEPKAAGAEVREGGEGPASPLEGAATPRSGVEAAGEGGEAGPDGDR
jgi:hypothetical protein